eukprot:scaffold2968_cov321-Pinguiococcus_pyrenoidosus.AAC.2
MHSLKRNQTIRVRLAEGFHQGFFFPCESRGAMLTVFPVLRDPAVPLLRPRELIWGVLLADRDSSILWLLLTDLCVFSMLVSFRRPPPDAAEARGSSRLMGGSRMATFAVWRA